MRVRDQDVRAIFVSFSGIDGAGKSTQIEALSSRLREDGLRVELIRFWDDIARLKRIRETAGHVIFKGDRGVGSPSAPIIRRDKNVESRLMTVVRLLLYIVDAVSLRFMVRKVVRSGADLVIFDRYTWDELANLNLSNRIIRAYLRLLLAFVPRPCISFLLDADPLQARARKPEYPVEFLCTNRRNYLILARLIGDMTVIDPMPVHEVEREVMEHAVSKLSIQIVKRLGSSNPSRTERGYCAESDNVSQVSPPLDDSACGRWI